MELRSHTIVEYPLDLFKCETQIQYPQFNLRDVILARIKSARRVFLYHNKAEVNDLLWKYSWFVRYIQCEWINQQINDRINTPEKRIRFNNFCQGCEDTLVEMGALTYKCWTGCAKLKTRIQHVFDRISVIVSQLYALMTDCEDKDGDAEFLELFRYVKHIDYEGQFRFIESALSCK